ncbi:dTDP-4-dehydrorhamnose reductase [Maribacter polysiphoniae]|uniref:dTDP-4-dehydrorhamnose reductase n=1 Tax=Maribacter polysiphoniae TaxID=429344 RepID=UPI00235684BB|nr:dTDP-4-dehydrorhamnose reductase [Maribacter polysiphoniae]
MINVLVTGGNGQLANCIKDLVVGIKGYNFIYVDIEDLDITDELAVDRFFKLKKPAWCVNCAAYTAVDKAETDFELAKNVNVNGPKYLARASKKYKSKLIQISTDFVFDGIKGSTYTEEDPTNPISVYGSTKLEGEQVTIDGVDEHFILRTSWLYSEHGNNFMKTMLRLGSERDELNVVGNQIGTPTYAGDLAVLIVKLIKDDAVAYGLYHFSNEGVASWYDFTMAIFDLAKVDCKVLPINTDGYPTPAKRPSFSVMDKSKIKSTFNIEIPYWRDSLKQALAK